jgi:hypothetical protein
MGFGMKKLKCSSRFVNSNRGNTLDNEKDTNRVIKEKVIEWLSLDQRTDEEIADKFCDAITMVYDEVKKKNIADEMRLELFKVLCKPPEPIKMKWHGLW